MSSNSFWGAFPLYSDVISAGKPPPGSIACYSLGGTAPLDGLQGVFNWNPTSTATQNTDPTGQIILNPGLGSSPGRWYLALSPAVSAFGAGFFNWNSSNYSAIVSPLLACFNGAVSCKAISIGDSLSHGTVQIGATSGYNITAQQGWMWQFGLQMGVLGFPQVSFDNFCGTSLSATSYVPGDSRLTQPVQWNINGSFSYGIGGPPCYSWAQASVINEVSPTEAFDTLRVMTITDVTYGAFKVYLDAVLLDTINTNPADSVLAKTYSVTRGVHTVSIETVNTTSCFCMSVSCEDSLTKYLYCDALGGGGYTTDTWLSAVSTGRQLIPDQLDGYDPFQLAFIWLGANDMFIGTPVANFHANLITIVQYVQSKGVTPILINTPLSNTPGFPSLAVQSQFAAAVYATALSENVPLFDMNTLINGNDYTNISAPTPGQTAGYVGHDGTHFTYTNPVNPFGLGGYVLAGQTLANLLFRQMFISP